MLRPGKFAVIIVGSALAWAASAGDDAHPPRQPAVDARSQDLSFAANPGSDDLAIDDFTKDLHPHSEAKAKPDRPAASSLAQNQKPASAMAAPEGAVSPTKSPDTDALPAQPSPTASPGTLDLTVALPEVLVNGKRDAFSQTDQRLNNLAVALPCAGCDGRRNDDPPKIVQIGTAVAVKALKSLFFSQPRVRGEPNDEALYLAHDGVCTPDDPYRCLYRPQMP